MYFVCASARVCVVNDRLITRPALDPSRESGISQHRTQPLDLSFKAIMVSTMTRFDLLDMHLKSIDSPIRRVFGLLNHAKVVIKQGMLNTISRYEGCGKGVGECSNPNILELHLIVSPNNVGVSGSMNTGIKVMLKYAAFVETTPGLSLDALRLHGR